MAAAVFVGVVVSQLLLLLLLVSASVGRSDKSDDTLVKNCTAETHGSISIFFYKVVQNKHSCLHIAWSMPFNSSRTSTYQSYPSMFIGYSKNPKPCECQPLLMEENTEEDVMSDVLLLQDEMLDYSMGVVFRGIYEFPATDKKLASKALNLTYACSVSDDMEHGVDPFDSSNNDTMHNYFHFSEVEDWTYVDGNRTLIGRVGNFTRYSFRLGVPTETGVNKLKYFPKTQFHENSTTFDFISDNYTCVSNWSRLALDMLIVHGPGLKTGSIAINKTTDDEYTPSVFSVYTYSAEPGESSLSSAWFFQWKPISYQDGGRKSTSSQQVTINATGGIQDCELELIPESLVSQLYGENHGNITRWFVVFGTEGDDSYLPPTYNTWTVALGTGRIPTESLSFVVIITIIVGFGVPGGLVILSMVYVVLRKKPWQAVARLMNRNRGYSKLS